MNHALETFRIRPVIDSEYSFAQVSQAFERLNKGPFGKVVIRLNDE
jgi:NADPH:quinone reductase-like Zn-dependent oxidoreductase